MHRSRNLSSERVAYAMFESGKVYVVRAYYIHAHMYIYMYNFKIHVYRVDPFNFRLSS